MSKEIKRYLRPYNASNYKIIIYEISNNKYRRCTRRFAHILHTNSNPLARPS